MNSYFERLYMLDVGLWILLVVPTTLAGILALNVDDYRMKIVFLALFVLWALIGLLAIFKRGAVIRRQVARLAREAPLSVIVGADAFRKKSVGSSSVSLFSTGCLVFESSGIKVYMFSSISGDGLEKVETIGPGDIQEVIVDSVSRFWAYPSIRIFTVSGVELEANPIKQASPAWTGGATWRELRGLAGRIRNTTGIEVEVL